MASPRRHRHGNRHQPSAAQILWRCWKKHLGLPLSRPFRLPYPRRWPRGLDVEEPAADLVWRPAVVPTQLSRLTLAGRPPFLVGETGPWAGSCGRSAAGAASAGGRPPGLSPCRGAPRQVAWGKVRLNWGWNYWRQALWRRPWCRPGGRSKRADSSHPSGSRLKTQSRRRLSPRPLVFSSSGLDVVVRASGSALPHEFRRRGRSSGRDLIGVAPFPQPREPRVVMDHRHVVESLGHVGVESRTSSVEIRAFW